MIVRISHVARHAFTFEGTFFVGARLRAAARDCTFVDVCTLHKKGQIYEKNFIKSNQTSVFMPRANLSSKTCKPSSTFVSQTTYVKGAIEWKKPIKKSEGIWSSQNCEVIIDKYNYARRAGRISIRYWSRGSQFLICKQWYRKTRIFIDSNISKNSLKTRVQNIRE